MLGLWVFSKCDGIAKGPHSFASCQRRDNTLSEGVFSKCLPKYKGAKFDPRKLVQ